MDKSVWLEYGIVGAGVAGLAASAQLAAHSAADVMMWDKGTGVGGRVATRRIGAGRADHGAQFMTARSTLFQEAVETWRASSQLCTWGDGTHARWIGADSMNGWLKQWSVDLAVRTKVALACQVSAILPCADGWRVIADDDREWLVRRLLLTMPVPQVLALLRPIQAALQHAAWRALETVQYKPCLTLLIEMDGPSQVPAPGYVRDGLPQPVAWIADNQQKGISATTILTVQLDGDWSAAHYDEEPSSIEATVVPLLATWVGRANVVSLQLKKWRYALAATTLPEWFVSLTAADSLLVAGDGFYGSDSNVANIERAGRIETAFLSGHYAAQHWLRHPRPN